MILYCVMFRLLFSVIFLSLMYLVQRFWFLRAWRFIDSIRQHRGKILLRCLLITAALLLLATVLDLSFGRFISRWGLVNLALSTSRLWLLASFFGFLAVLSVAVLGWLSRLAMH